MSSIPSIEGKAPFPIDSIDKECFTFYKVFGDLNCGVAPVICLHGGPGAGHAGNIAFAELWPRYEIPVVFYDQIGCGQSTLLPETAGDQSFWQVSLFVRELNNLIDHLHLRAAPGYHVLSRSFGGYIALDFAISQPRGLKKIILGSASASKALSMQSLNECRDLLPREHRDAINRAVEARDFDGQDYKTALDVFVKMFLVRGNDKLPTPTKKSPLDSILQDKTVYHTLYVTFAIHGCPHTDQNSSGPSPWYQTGSMLGWTAIPRLQTIKVPTLVYNSEFDTSARDCAVKPFFDLIPHVKWVTVSNAGHVAHVESPELKDRMLTLVGDFLVPSSYTI